MVCVNSLSNLEFHEMVVKEHHKKKFKDITADILKETKAKNRFKKVIQQQSGSLY